MKMKDQISNIIDDNEDELNQIWNELDDEFYKYEENLHGLLLTYVQDNIKYFR